MLLVNHKRNIQHFTASSFVPQEPAYQVAAAKSWPAMITRYVSDGKS